MKHLIEARGITQLIHFTRLENLDSILAHGIRPRRLLNPSEAIFNDDWRLDSQEGASSFSISFPNYRMFYRYRDADRSKHWVVLACKPSVLWEKDCAFCMTNAAHASVAAIPIESRKGETAFQSLFEERDNKPPRSLLRLKDHDPTDPQAEVLVFDIVEPHFITSVCCLDRGLCEALKPKHPQIDVKHAPGMFSARADYEYWR